MVPRTPQPESPEQRVSSRLSEYGIGLAIIGGLLVIAGIVVGTGITGYAAMAADEGNCLEQAWALNRYALSHSTSWYEKVRLGWIELWLMANLVGAVVSGQSAAVQGQILALALAGVALVYVWAPGGSRGRRAPGDLGLIQAAVREKDRTAAPARARLDSLASTVILNFDALKPIGWAASFELGSGESNVFQKRSA